MIYAIDTETTGKEPPEVIELAYGPLEMGSLMVISDTVNRYRPTFGSSYGALSAHHILDSELKNCEPSITAKLPGDADYIVGHNVDYDWKALGSPPEVKRICTLAMARFLYPDCDSHTLSAMIYRLEPNQEDARYMLKNAHSARADMLMAARILSYMLAAIEVKFTTPELLWEFSERCRIPTIFTFGKYKGMQIDKTPRDYRQWFLRQADVDPYVLKAIKATL